MKLAKLSLLLLPVLGLSSCGLGGNDDPIAGYQVPEASIENYQRGWTDMKNYVIDNGVNGILSPDLNTVIGYTRPDLTTEGAIICGYTNNEYSIETIFYAHKTKEQLNEMKFVLTEDGVAISTYTAVTHDMEYVTLKDIEISPDSHSTNIVSATEIQGRLLTTKLVDCVTSVIKTNNLYPLYW